MKKCDPICVSPRMAVFSLCSMLMFISSCKTRGPSAELKGVGNSDCLVILEKKTGRRTFR